MKPDWKKLLLTYFPYLVIAWLSIRPVNATVWPPALTRW